MDKRAWIGQLKKQVAAKGADAAPWYVYWNDPETGRQKCKSCGPGKVGRSAAERLADTIHSQLVTGTYQANERLQWGHHLDRSTRQAPKTTFMARWNEHVDAMYDGKSLEGAKLSLKTFERVAQPSLMKSITTSTIDKFVAKRLAEKTGRKDADGNPTKVSASTVNRELRYIKAALRLAKDWKFISEVPRIRMLKPLQKHPTYVTPEHFAAIYQACEAATMPGNVANVSACDWWRGLIVFLYMSGWRIGQTMALKWADIDLENGTAMTNAADNKGGRDQVIPLHPFMREHLERLAGSFSTKVFPWKHPTRALWEEFGRIQAVATTADGKAMPKAGKNGAWYGFHDLRRGFATANAESMNLFELQALMQHKSLETTKGYVNMAKKLNRAVSTLFVPTVAQAKNA